MDFTKCLDMVEKEIEKVTSNLLVSVNGSFGRDDELVFGKNLKSFPDNIEMEIYQTECGVRSSLSNSKSVSFKLNYNLAIRAENNKF